MNSRVTLAENVMPDSFVESGFRNEHIIYSKYGEESTIMACLGQDGQTCPALHKTMSCSKL